MSEDEIRLLFKNILIVYGFNVSLEDDTALNELTAKYEEDAETEAIINRNTKRVPGKQI